MARTLDGGPWEPERPLRELSQLYTQCHEHLRHADDKRDQLIGFYAVVIGLLFAGFEKIDESLKSLVTLAIGLLGFFVVVAVIHYRRWHTIYTSCFATIQHLDRLAHTPSSADVIAAWDKSKPPQGFWAQWKLLNPLGGTEAATFAALLVLSFVPWYFLFRGTECGWCRQAGSEMTAFLVDLLLYSLLICVLASLLFYRASKRPPFDHWPLASLDP